MIVFISLYLEHRIELKSHSNHIVSLFFFILDIHTSSYLFSEQGLSTVTSTSSMASIIEEDKLSTLLDTIRRNVTINGDQYQRRSIGLTGIVETIEYLCRLFRG